MPTFNLQRLFGMVRTNRHCRLDFIVSGVPANINDSAGESCPGGYYHKAGIVTSL